MISRFKLQFCCALLSVAVVVAGCGGPAKLDKYTAAELYKMAKDKYDHKKYYRSIEMFQNLVYAHAGEAIVDTAQYYLAMSYFGNSEYQLASAEFNRLIMNYPSSAFAEHAQFMRAASTYETAPRSSGLDQSDLKPAMDQLQDFITDRPESPYLDDAKALLLKARTRLARKTFDAAIVYFRVESYDAAAVYFQKVVDDYLDTEYAPKSLFMIADGEYKMKHFDKSREKFEGFIKVFPKHAWVARAKRRAADAAFNLGLASFKAGQVDKAREQFQSFKDGYPTDERVKEADAYLTKSKESAVELKQAGKAGS